VAGATPTLPSAFHPGLQLVAQPGRALVRVNYQPIDPPRFRSISQRSQTPDQHLRRQLQLTSQTLQVGGDRRFNPRKTWTPLQSYQRNATLGETRIPRLFQIPIAAWASISHPHHATSRSHASVELLDTTAATRCPRRVAYLHCPIVVGRSQHRVAHSASSCAALLPRCATNAWRSVIDREPLAIPAGPNEVWR